MLHNITELYGHKLAATDGELGHVKDFYFDDKTWVVRYLVADTGSWLPGRLVLVSPHAFGPLDPEKKTLHLKLHRKQVENSPSIEAHRPVSRQYEIEYYRYYGWPAYWEGGAMWGLSGFPAVLPPSPEEMESHRQHQHRDDKHLQSTRSVTGFAIQATDGLLGHLSGFLVDNRSWAIHQLVVETGHWYAGKEILIAPAKIERISYEDSKVAVNLTQADIRQLAENYVAKVSA